jgi:preprotein translocase subunit Sec63
MREMSASIGFKFGLMMVIALGIGVSAFAGKIDQAEVDRIMSDNPYSRLNVSKSASARDLLLSYRTLSKRYHPDSPEIADSEFKDGALFIKINEAL